MNKKQRKQREKRHRIRHDPLTIQQTSALQDDTQERQGEEKLCLWTQTGELFQPVRVYYTLKKSQKVVETLLHLHCMEFVPEEDRWVWLLTDEAQDLPFSPRAASSHQTPLVLGSLCLRKKRLMYLELSSWQRALAAIPFFDTYIPRHAAKVSHLGVVNHLFGEDDRQGICFNNYFRTDVYFKDRSLAMMAKLAWIMIRTRNMQKRMALLDTLVNKEMNTPDPDVEYLKIRYYQDGLQQLQFMLSSRQQVAIQRSQGNSAYTHADYVNEIMHTIMPNENRTGERKR